MEDINFCGCSIPNKAVCQHFLLVGTTGSGKTNVLRMMMHSALTNVRNTALDHRAVIYDQKQDMVGLVRAQGVSDEHLRLLNPYDRRCYEWDMARDVTGQDTAFQIASIFIPEEDSQNRYFSDAARGLVAGVMNVFIEKGIERKKSGEEPDWRLADVVYALRSEKRLRHVLEHTPEGKELIELHLENEKTTASILSTADTRLTPLTVPAALWRRAGDRGRKLSLEEFLCSPYVLVLGNNQQARRPLQALNRIIFQRLTELTLDLSETDNDSPLARRVWFFLDEVRKIGKLDGLDDLMNNGRSKGAVAVLAFQDIDGMRQVYGKEIAQEMAGMCGNYCFLKMSGTETPLWASQVIGESEDIIQMGRKGESRGSGDRRSDTGTSDQIHKSSLVLPSQFTSLPYPSRDTGIPFFAIIPSVGNGVIDGSSNERLLPEEVERGKGPAPDVEDNICPWAEINDYHFKKLPAWRDADFTRLGIAPMQSHEEDVSASETLPPPASQRTEEKRAYRRPAPPLEEVTTYNGR